MHSRPAGSISRSERTDCSQQDIGFKSLGLLVIDEEQRFGVEHKERLKKLRREVDVLTLSATPIPVPCIRRSRDPRHVDDRDAARKAAADQYVRDGT